MSTNGRIKMILVINIGGKMKNTEKVSIDSKVIILDSAIGKVLDLFSNTFLSAYFYKLTQDNMIYISVYYIIVWIMATIGALLVGNYIKRKNKVCLYRCGIIIDAIFILLIIILKEKILDYVWLMAIIYGIAVATTGFPFNMMESELVNEKERTKYIGYKHTIGEITKVVAPIFLGAYITYTSYQIAAILVFIFTIIKLINSLFIKNINVEKEKMDLRKFINTIKEKTEYPINKLLIIEFLKGITVNGVLEKIIALLIIYEVQTELNLGIWSSLFSICMIVTMFIFARKYNKNNSKTILTICSLSIITSFILLLFSINMTTIVLYNIVYYVFIKIMYSVTEINLFDYSNIAPFDKELNVEYFIFREIFLNIGRVLGYTILLIVGFTHNLEYLKIFFLCMTITLIIIIRMSKNINRKRQIEKI